MSSPGFEHNRDLVTWDQSERRERGGVEHLWGWCWGCCHDYCRPAAASRAGCSDPPSDPSWGPESSWGWRSGCTGCQSWPLSPSCWTAPTASGGGRGESGGRRARTTVILERQRWREKKKKVTLLSLPDLLGEGAGLGGRKLLVVEVCKHTAQYGVMLEQKKKSQNDICVFNMCHPAGTKTNLGKDVDTVKAATALNNQKNQLQPTVSGARFRLRLLTWTGSRSAMHWLTLPTWCRGGGGTLPAQEVECSECTFILTHWQLRSKRPPCRQEDRSKTEFVVCTLKNTCTYATRAELCIIYTVWH